MGRQCERCDGKLRPDDTHCGGCGTPATNRCDKCGKVAEFWTEGRCVACAVLAAMDVVEVQRDREAGFDAVDLSHWDGKAL